MWTLHLSEARTKGAFKATVHLWQRGSDYSRVVEGLPRTQYPPKALGVRSFLLSRPRSGIQ